MDTGNKYQVNDYNKTNNISTVDIMNDNDNNNNNNILENNNNDNNIFKQIEEEENEARKIEHELDTVSKSEILKAMPASFRFAAKLVFLFENDKHPIKFILKWISIIASIYFGITGLLNIQENGQLKIGIAQLPAPICFCIYGPMSIMKVHHFFNGNVGRSAFLKSWKKLPKSSKPSYGIMPLGNTTVADWKQVHRTSHQPDKYTDNSLEKVRQAKHRHSNVSC